MQYKDLLLEKKSGIATITLNVPDKMNAFSTELGKSLALAVGEISKDDKVRVVIVTGAGRGFCAGADIKEMNEGGGQRQSRSGSSRFSFFNRLEELPKPVIAAINGPCNGGGLELALSCDFRIASEAANFGLGEVKLGVIPAGGGTARLPRLIGPGRAKEFLYFGNRVDGQEAYRLGIVNKVVPHDQLEKFTYNLADLIANKRSPMAVRLARYNVYQSLNQTLTEHLDTAGIGFHWSGISPYSREARKAWVEKREPDFDNIDFDKMG